MIADSTDMERQPTQQYPEDGEIPQPPGPGDPDPPGGKGTEVLGTGKLRVPLHLRIRQNPVAGGWDEPRAGTIKNEHGKYEPLIGVYVQIATSTLSFGPLPVVAEKWVNAYPVPDDWAAVLAKQLGKPLLTLSAGGNVAKAPTEGTYVLRHDSTGAADAPVQAEFTLSLEKQLLATAMEMARKTTGIALLRVIVHRDEHPPAVATRMLVPEK